MSSYSIRSRGRRSSNRDANASLRAESMGGWGRRWKAGPAHDAPRSGRARAPAGDGYGPKSHQRTSASSALDCERPETPPFAGICRFRAGRSAAHVGEIRSFQALVPEMGLPKFTEVEGGSHPLQVLFDGASRTRTGDLLGAIQGTRSTLIEEKMPLAGLSRLASGAPKTQIRGD